MQNEELGGTPLNLYDFGARFYDPQYLLRFTGIDPMAEKRFNISPYAYCSNNPISRVDPTGMRDTDYRNEKGELLYKTDDGLTDVIIVPDNNIPKLEKKLNEAHAEEKIDDPATNQEEMHVLGKTPQEYSEGPAKGMDSYWRYGYRETYEEAYKEGKSQFSLGQIASSIVAAIATDNDDSSGITRHDGRSSGILDGNYDRGNGKINRLNPHSSFKSNKPLLTVPKLEPIKRYPGVGLPPM